MENSQTQRTREWFLDRKGKISASEIYLLLNNHKEAMTEEELAEFKKANPKSRTTTKEVPFSDGTFTYLNKKIAELFMSDDAYLEDVDIHQVNNKAMQYGTFWEDTARQRYALEMGYEVYETGFIPLKGFEVYAGGSPDGLISGEKGLIEIKCPFNSEVHQDYLLFERPEDLKEYNIQYYSQVQMNIIVTDSEFCDFVSFDPRTIRDKQIKVIRIPKDVQFCNILLERIALAKDYYIERMDKLSNIKTIIK